MGGTSKDHQPPQNPPKKDHGKPGKPPPVATEDDDVDDGDFATPKRDRDGDDDQPL